MAKTKAAAKRKTTKKAATKKAAKKTTSTKKPPKKKAADKKVTAKKATAKRASSSRKSAKKKTKLSRAKETMTPDDEVTIDRRRSERRQDPEIVAGETQSIESPTPERRKKVPRRRQIDPTTCERDYSEDEIEFMHALDEYKRANGRMFPTCSEILEVVRDLGYAKIEKQPESTQQVTGPESASSETADTSDVVAGDIATATADSVPPQESDALGLPIAEMSGETPGFSDNYTF